LKCSQAPDSFHIYTLHIKWESTPILSIKYRCLPFIHGSRKWGICKALFLGYILSNITLNQWSYNAGNIFLEQDP
jgi:hypothetical protein